MSIDGNGLGDAGLRPLFEALACNTRLRRLCICDSRMSAAFARDVLLPAVCANTSLRELMTGWEVEHACGSFLREAEALVKRRTDAAAE
jgi:hypothetical protein